MNTHFLWRRRLLIAAGLSLSFAAQAQAQAPDYPSKPIRLVAPFAAGASTDRLARIVADSVAKSLGQQVIVENKAGAGGNLAADTVAKAAPDGHTFLLVSAGIVTMNQHIYKKLSFDPLKDFAPLTIAVRMPLLVIANNDVPIKTPKELIDYARTNPGKLTYGSAGVGTSQHLAGELFKSMAKVDVLHVPYKGGAPAMTDLLGGQVALMFVQAPSAQPQVKAGKVRAIAIGSPKRSALFPDVPTLAESGLPGYASDTWYGFVAPAGTPAPVLAKLQAAIVAGLKENAAKLAEDGFNVDAGSAAAMGAQIRAESVKWGEVIRAAKIEAE
jgi:tripartite-type tricarboxylate transporter receptor subunit TctC